MQELKLTTTSGKAYRLLTADGAWVGPGTGHFYAKADAYAWARDNGYLVRLRAKRTPSAAKKALRAQQVAAAVTRATNMWRAAMERQIAAVDGW